MSLSSGGLAHVEVVAEDRVPTRQGTQALKQPLERSNSSDRGSTRIRLPSMDYRYMRDDNAT